MFIVTKFKCLFYVWAIIIFSNRQDLVLPEQQLQQLCDAIILNHVFTQPVLNYPNQVSTTIKDIGSFICRNHPQLPPDSV